MPADDIAALDLPFQEAIEFFRQKARIPSSHWTDLWRTAHSRGFMVAGAATDALLADFQASIAKALEQGTSLGDFRKDFDRIVQTHGWVHNGKPGWRSRIIYETNLSTAYSAGRWVQMTDPDVRVVYPFWQYVHSSSSHPRLQHLAWNGLTLRCDDAFWASHYPPNGWHCGCRVRPVSRGDLSRMGKTSADDAPPIQTRPWRNPKTGAVTEVPIGIDPGFDYNPGMAWKEGLRDVPARSEPLRPMFKQPPGPTDAQQDALRAFVANPQGDANVGRMSEGVRRLLGSSAPEVKLSADTMRKQLATHQDLTVDDYLLLPLIVSDPTVVLAKGGRRLALLNAGAKVLVAILKTTLARDENFVVSLYAARDRSVRTLLNRNAVLLGDAANVLRAKE